MKETSNMAGTVKIAGMQIDSKILGKEQNLKRCLGLIQTAAGNGAHLIVFPEAMLSGYAYHSLEEAFPVMETIPGPCTETIGEYCRKFNLYTIIGLLEKDKGKYYNTSAFVGPGGLIGKYRKLHLPYAHIDRFLNHGDLPLKVYATDIGKIGLGICYDTAFPEHARILTLLGAEVIIIITAWPVGMDAVPEYEVPTRARENNVYFMSIDRVGEERGTKFLGRSKCVDFLGRTIVEGKAYEEEILYAEIQPALSSQKIRGSPDKPEIDILRDRRPEFYTVLTQPLSDNSRIR
jgi:5-aminopentanamidase